MNGALWTLGFVWALPGTLVGLVLAALSLGRGRWRRGVLWVDATRGVAAPIARRGRPSATTFGHVVMVWQPQRLDEALEAHELVHVRQYQLMGVFFFPVYLALRLRYGGGRRHPLEKPGYAAAEAVRNRR